MKVNKFVNDLRGQTKAKLFEVPKKPLPAYFHEYQDMLLLKIHVCQEIIESNEITSIFRHTIGRNSQELKEL
ncbi:unnamed protein product [Rhizophagus irregularis]|nr:unnamed protein product [Rhizophagus irregularis]